MQRWSFRFLMVTVFMAVSFYSFFCTTFGLNIVCRSVLRMTANHLEIQGLKGCLLSPMTFHVLHYKDKNYDILLSNCRVVIRPMLLFKKKLWIESFSIRSIKIESPHTQSTQTPQVPQWLRYLNVQKVSIQTFIFKTPLFCLEGRGDFSDKLPFFWQLHYQTPPKDMIYLQSFAMKGTLQGAWTDSFYLILQGSSSSLNIRKSKKQAYHIPSYDFRLCGLPNHFTCTIKEKSTLKTVHQNVAYANVRLHKIQTASQSIKTRCTIQMKLHLSHWETIKKINLPLEKVFLPNAEGMCNIYMAFSDYWSYWESLFFSSSFTSFKIQLKKLLSSSSLKANIFWVWKDSFLPRVHMPFKYFMGSSLLQDQIIGWDSCLSDNNQGHKKWYLTGMTYLFERKKFSMKTKLQLTGDDLTVAPKQNIIMTIRPKIHITVDEKRTSIHGKLQMPSAQLSMQYSEPVPMLDSDIIWPHVENKKQRSYRMKISIQLGDTVCFYFSTLKAKLRGKLLLEQKDQNPILAQGDIRLVEGEYDYYGKRLQVDTMSRFLFHERFANPKVDIKASRSLQKRINHQHMRIADANEDEIQNKHFAPQINIGTHLPPHLQVGLRLHGDLEDPKISIYATPSGWMQHQSDATAYFLADQTARQLTQTSFPMVFYMVGQFGFQYLNTWRIVSYLKRKFKPQLHVYAMQDTTQVLGSMQLHPKWSIAMARDLQKRTLGKINYLFTPHWISELSYGHEGAGIGFMYQRESD